MFETCCNFSATKIASSCCDKNRLCKRALSKLLRIRHDMLVARVQIPKVHHEFVINWICKSCKVKAGVHLNRSEI